ncbi:MAG: hypothetical protein JWN07_92 [Hyphomicrobiales bacterium]|nr:hypothetical protein [Hyphomicrobiales bacterium]
MIEFISQLLRSSGLFGLLVMAVLSAPAQADPGFKSITVSSVKDGPAEIVFAPDVAKIFVRAELVDVPLDAKMSCAWVAAAAVGVPQNYVIDTAELIAGTVLGIRVNILNCNLSKPNAGFPTGSYRIDLFVDSKKTNDAVFEIKGAALPAAEPVAAAPVLTRGKFTVVNRTGYDISEVYVSPASANVWGEELLGDDELEDGDEEVIRLGRKEKSCIWDLKVVYSDDDSEAVWRDVDLCKFEKMTIKYNRKSDKTSATFE